MKTTLLLTVIASLLSIAPAAHASCCEPDSPTMMMMTANSEANDALMDPVKSVLDNYLKIQSALAKDSTDGIAPNAAAIASVVRGDSMKMLAPRVADEADALAKAKDLASARQAFKPLSKSLLQYLHDHNVIGTYTEVYCPMAKASWLQNGKKIENPYMSGSMRSCGEIQKSKAETTNI